jgi:hypothetical protein
MIFACASVTGFVLSALTVRFMRLPLSILRIEAMPLTVLAPILSEIASSISAVRA